MARRHLSPGAGNAQEESKQDDRRKSGPQAFTDWPPNVPLQRRAITHKAPFHIRLDCARLGASVPLPKSTALGTGTGSCCLTLMRFSHLL